MSSVSKTGAPSTNQSRILAISILLQRLGLAEQIDLSLMRVSLEVKAWAKTQECSANLEDSTARLLDNIRHNML